jgi:hypothetical protein
MCCVAVNGVELTRNFVQWKVRVFVMSSTGAVLRALLLVT